MTPPPPRPRPWWSVLTGTRPGLEWFLFAAFPAIAAGALAAHFLGPVPGVVAAVVVLVAGMALARRLVRRAPGGPTDSRR